MNRKRLTREDARAQTTERLLAAAQKVIAKKGLSAASVEDIAQAAGYSRGAFYSNFRSKDDLFIELLRRDHQATQAQFRALQDDSIPMDRIHERTREIYAHMYRDTESFINWAEARMLAIRDARFRAKMNALLAEKTAENARFIDYFYRRLGVAPPVPVSVMAMGFMSLYEGVQLSMLSSPADMTPQNAEGVLSLFIESIMQMAGSQGSLRTRS